LAQLNEVNERTYRASADAMDAWLREDLTDNTEQESRRGLAMFTQLAQQSVEHRLPMKLDY
jgi:hypothetical protein